MANARVQQAVVELVTFNSPNAQVQQAVVELITLGEPNPNARVQQAVIELITLLEPITVTAPFQVIIRGVKRFPLKAPPSICKPVDEEKHSGILEDLTKWIG